MTKVKKVKLQSDTNASAAPSPVADENHTATPWELVEAGRYRPRRIKGSCVGRELG